MQVILTSAAEKTGIDELWKLLQEYQDTMLEHNEFFAKREYQLKRYIGFF